MVERNRPEPLNRKGVPKGTVGVSHRVVDVSTAAKKYVDPARPTLLFGKEPAARKVITGLGSGHPTLLESKNPVTPELEKAILQRLAEKMAAKDLRGKK